MENGFNILDLAIVVLLAFFLLRGLIMGFIREIMGLVALAVALVISAVGFKPVSDLLARMINIELPWWDALAFGLIVIVIFILFGILGRALARVIHSGPFSGLDRLAGGVAGLAKGMLFGYLLLSLLFLFVPAALPPVIKESQLAPYVLKSGRAVIDVVPSSLTGALKEKSGLLYKLQPPGSANKPSDPKK